MAEQNVFTYIFVFFALLTVKDLFFSAEQTKSPLPYDPLSDTDNFNSVGPLSSGSVPTIKVLYCHSCGYRQAFEDLARKLTVQFPTLNVVGEYHKPGWIRSQVANLVFLLKIGFFVMLYTRFDPFNYFRMETPRFWNTILENKVAASVMTLLLASSIENSMMSTGAYEVYFNGMPIWSKIDTGRIPTFPEIVNIISNHLSLTKNFAGYGMREN